jgi:hypothetical protein
MKIISTAILLGLGIGAAPVVGCTAPSRAGSTQDAPNPEGETATVGLELQLGPEIVLSTVNYIVENPTLAGFSTWTGSVDVSGSQTIAFSLTLPVSTGYTLWLNAIDSNGDGCAAGPAAFSVIADQTTAAALTLVCDQLSDSGAMIPDVNVGSVIVAADASLVTRSACAAATSLLAMPNETTVGSTIGLTATGVDPSGQSSDVTLTWFASGGSGSQSAVTGTSNTLTCTSAGQEIITVTAALANGGASCPGIGSLAITVTCDADEAGIPDAEASDGDEPTGPTAQADSGGQPDVSGTGAEAGDAAAGPGAGADSSPEADLPEAQADGPAETGVPDAKSDGSADASEPDAGAEAGVDASSLVPCTTPGQADCVKCTGNTAHGSACTPTEQIIVNLDIQNGYVTGSQLSELSCYECLFQSGCIDDDKYHDVNHECGDLSGTVGAGDQSLETKTQACLTALACEFASGCQNAAGQNPGASDGIRNCFCGSNNPTAAGCAAAPTIAAGPAAMAPNGSCAQAELDGLGDTTSTSNATVIAGLMIGTTGTGMANNILVCAGANTGAFSCPSCFQ